ncbi:MAG: membrane protein [Cytophagia bacterium]|nr:membrane protein [Cytophagia bacterium]
MVTKVMATLALLSLYVVPLIAQPKPVALEGFLDARSHNFNESSIALNGQWQYYANQQVEHYDKLTVFSFINFPHRWDDANSQGVATYKLKVVVDRSQQKLALDIPQLYCAYSLWMNGTLIAKNGEVGSSRRTTLPQWLPQVVSFPVDKDTLQFTLQIANFHHAIGGIKNPILMGLPDQMLEQQSRAYVVNMILLGVLTFLGLFFITIYAFVKREKSALYFALLCLVWALRSIFSEQYLAIHWMPWFDWELALKIEYITLYFTMASAIQFVSKLYMLDTNQLIKKILLYPNYLFVFLTMATPAVVYTNLLNIYLILAGVLLFYIVIIILRAMLFERHGAWFSVSGVLALALAFTYNYLSYQGVFKFSPFTFYTLYLCCFLLLAIALAYQLSPAAKSKNVGDTLTFDDYVTNK